LIRDQKLNPKYRRSGMRNTDRHRYKIEGTLLPKGKGEKEGKFSHVITAPSRADAREWPSHQYPGSLKSVTSCERIKEKKKEKKHDKNS
jgi:hypothetical protein